MHVNVESAKKLCPQSRLSLLGSGRAVAHKSVGRFLREKTAGNAKLLAACAILSFIPLTLGYSVEHDISVRIAQSSTQIVLIILCFVILSTGRAKFGWDKKTAVFVASCIGVAQFLAVSHNSSDEKNYIMPLVFPLFLLAGPIALSLAQDIRVERNGKSVAKIGRFLLGFFCVECATRYLLSPFVRANLNVAVFGSEQVDTDWLYRYKQSIFFPDSNSVGLALLCLIAVLLVFRQHFRKGHVFLAYALVGATLSRASITAAICQLFIYKFWRWRRWILLVTIIAVPLLLSSLFTIYSTEGADTLAAVDGSFASKFQILQQMVGVWSEADTLQKLVGIGAGNTEGVIGMAAHSIVAGFTLELGLVGSALVIAYVWLLSRRSCKAFYLLTLPIIINGVSLILTSMPYFYVTLGFLSAVTDQRVQNLLRERCLPGPLKSATEPYTRG